MRTCAFKCKLKHCTYICSFVCACCALHCTANQARGLNVHLSSRAMAQLHATIMASALICKLTTVELSLLTSAGVTLGTQALTVTR
jgi:hypothetical protein